MNRSRASTSPNTTTSTYTAAEIGITLRTAGIQPPISPANLFFAASLVISGKYCPGWYVRVFPDGNTGIVSAHSLVPTNVFHGNRQRESSFAVPCGGAADFTRSGSGSPCCKSLSANRSGPEIPISASFNPKYGGSASANVASALFPSTRDAPAPEIKVIDPSRVRKSSYTFQPVAPTLNSQTKVWPATSGAAPPLTPNSRLGSNSAAREVAVVFVATYPSTADVTPNSRKNSRRCIRHL